MIASRLQIRLPPAATLTTPTASVAIWALLMNHSGPRCHSLPWRSARGHVVDGADLKSATGGFPSLSRHLLSVP